MRWLICITALCLALPFAAKAASAEDNISRIYDEQLQTSGIQEIYSELPAEIRHSLAEMGITPESGQLPKLSAPDALNHILKMLRNGFKEPLRVCASLVGILLILSLVIAMISESHNLRAAESAGTLCVAATVLVPLYESLLAAISVLKGSATFMVTLVPTYCALLMAGGMTTTGSVASTFLLGAAQAVTQAVSFYLAPVMGMYLALSVSASASPLASGGNLAELIKKTATWALSAVLTVFLGVLSLQTGISASADTLSVRAARYLAGSIPLVGGAVGETVSVVKTSLSLLGKSAWGYGVIALGAMLLPVIVELVLWRLGLNISIAVCSVLNNRKIEGLVRSCDAVFAFLLGVTVYVGLLFIISLSIVSAAAGGAAI